MADRAPLFSFLPHDRCIQCLRWYGENGLWAQLPLGGILTYSPRLVECPRCQRERIRAFRRELLSV